jgi:predicted transcriptional regulator
MLEPLFGSKIREKVLIFIFAREKGYAREIARFFDTDINQVQKQLDNLETGGILVSQSVGRTRLYEFNPRYLVRNELLAILDKSLKFYPDNLREQLIMNRRRPRRKNKPL